MAGERSAVTRKKARYVCEVRYHPVSDVLDMRGRTLARMKDAFSPALQNWRVASVAVNLVDDLEAPAREIFVDHQLARLIMEDPKSTDEFREASSKMLDRLWTLFGSWLTAIGRIGVRSITVHDAPGCASFEDVRAKVMRTWMASTMPVDLNVTDLAVTLNHETGRIMVGPVRTGEDWAKAMFTRPGENMPAYGLGVDVDSSATEVAVSRAKDLLKAFDAVLRLTLMTEQDIVKACLETGAVEAK